MIEKVRLVWAKFGRNWSKHQGKGNKKLQDRRRKQNGGKSHKKMGRIGNKKTIQKQKDMMVRWKLVKTLG